MTRKGYFSGSMMLVLAAFFWGTTFIAQSDAMDFIGPFTFSAIRSAIAVPILFVLYVSLSREKAFLPFHKENIRHTLRGGLTCGIILFLATNLQNTGLIETSPGLGGFITSLYIIFVPIVSLLFRKRPHFSVWIFAGIAILGFYLLNITDGKFSISIWEILVLLCAISYSFHIIACEKYGSEMDCILLSCLQFAVVAVLSGACTVFDTVLLGFTPINGELFASSWFSIVYAAVFSSAIAFTLQIAGQKKVPATAAVLLMSLESVFAVVSAWMIKPEENALAPVQVVGCVVIFLAICAAQIPIPSKQK
jgi:drug/metabolite transporter (DMT)-like permease